MELVYVDGSPFARIVRILIREWQLDIVEREVDFPLPSEIDALTPLGQVPLLLQKRRPALFPTLNILEYLARTAGSNVPFAYDEKLRERMVIALSAGDALARAAYQHWSGLEPVLENTLGFDPGARNATRFKRTFRWLARDIEPEEITSVVLAVLASWVFDRQVSGIALDESDRDQFQGLLDRPSFRATMPRPYPALD